MAAGEHLPEEDAYGPDVAFRCRLLSREPFGRDVGERSRDVSDRRQRVCAVELREAEVEEPDGDLVPILEEDVGRLHVTMDDSRPVRVRERIEHLRRNLDGVLVESDPVRSASRNVRPGTYSYAMYTWLASCPTS